MRIAPSNDPMHALRTAASFALLLAVATAQQSLVCPPGSAATAGNSSSSFPWNRGNASMRHQNVFDTSSFTLQGANGPMLITKLRFRPDDGAAAVWAGGSWPNIRIDLASSPSDYLTLNPTFASNLAADVRTVYQGPVTVTPGATAGLGVPAAWYIEIPLQRAFYYDPTAGLDLTVDVYLDGTGWSGTSRAVDCVSAAGTSLASRVTDTTGIAAATGTVTNNFAVVTEFTYESATTLVPRFVADVTRGPSPLTVQFTDDSYTPAPGGAIAWLWDFNNDGVTDSGLQNPTHTFTGCGDFTVSLLVIDAFGTTRTVSYPAFVRTDLITPSFTFAQVGAGLFQFTDTSSPTATAWAWDFNGDSITDSTQQNPTYSYGPGCTAQVTLSVTRNCRTAQTTRNVLLASNSLSSSSGAAPNGQPGSPTVGACFDVRVNAAEGIQVCGITSFTHTDSAPFEVQVWVTQNSYATKENNQNFWRRIATGQGQGNGGTTSNPVATEVPLDAPFYLPQGNYGLAIYHGPRNGVGRGTMSWNIGAIGPFSTADLTIHPNPATASGVYRTGLFSGSSSSGNAWVGTLHYTKPSLSRLGGYGFLGSSCFGARGFVTNSAITTPRMGQVLTTQLTNMPLSIGLFWFGVTRYAPPIAGSAFGAPGCQLYASLDLSSLVIGANNSATYSIFIPSDPAFLGQILYAQGAAFDPTLNALGLSSSDGAALVIGL